MSDLSEQIEMDFKRALKDLTFAAFKYPADEDYIVARFAWFEGFTRQYLWSANQAIEKYIKCVQFLDGQSADFSHDWFDVFEKRACSNLRLLPINFSSLASVPDLEPDLALERQETTECYLRRISESGRPGVRYDEIPYLDSDALDLRKLDYICMWLMAICQLEPGSGAGFDVRSLAVSDIQKIRSDTYLKKDNFELYPSLTTDAYSGIRISGRQSKPRMIVLHAKYRNVDQKRLLEEFAKRSRYNPVDLEKLAVFPEVDPE